jgi:MFS family permease
MKQERPRIPRNVLVLGLVALASGFGQDLISPALPAYLALLGVSHAGIGLIDGLLQGSTSLFRMVSGVLSDRFRDRKRFVFLGYALSSLARPLLAVAGGFGAILGLRVIDGVGKGTKDAPRDALVAESAASGERGRAFGFHRLIDTAGSVFGPLTASALLLALAPTLATYRLVFLLAAIPGAAALLLIAFGVRERRPETPVASKAVAARLPTLFWLFTLASCLALLTKVNDALFLDRARDLGVASDLIPALFAAFTLVYALLSYPIGVWSDRVGRLPLIGAGWLLLAAVEFGFSRAAGVASAIALLLAYGVFFALTEGSGRALIADLVPASSRGTAFAVYYTATGLAVIAGGFGLGRLWDVVSPAFAFSLSAAGSLAGGAAFLLLARKREKAPLN